MRTECKRQHEKNNSSTWGNKPESSGERREIKEISIKSKTIQTKPDIPKQRKKILSITGRHDTKTYQQPDVKDTEQFWTRIWQQKKNNEKAEWINDMTRELEGLEESPKAEMHIKLLKKILNWKTPGHDGIHGFWFKKFTYIHDRLALEMNRCQQDAQVSDWMNKGKTT